MINFTPYDFQQKNIIDKLDSIESGPITLYTARWAGGTSCTIYYALKEAIENPNQDILIYIDPINSAKSRDELYDKITSMVNIPESHERHSVIYNFDNGSRIRLTSVLEEVDLLIILDAQAVYINDPDMLLDGNDINITHYIRKSKKSIIEGKLGRCNSNIFFEWMLMDSHFNHIVIDETLVDYEQIDDGVLYNRCKELFYDTPLWDEYFKCKYTPIMYRTLSFGRIASHRRKEISIKGL